MRLVHPPIPMAIDYSQNVAFNLYTGIEFHFTCKGTETKKACYLRQGVYSLLFIKSISGL
jgi:hypothetical protein